ncbi:Retrotransposon gag domain [Sesbania bispinosa]|nr:Retrotransposon gag domain [Sesbania bispinosa]
MVCIRMEARVERLEKLIEEERIQERSNRESFESWVQQSMKDREEQDAWLRNLEDMISTLLQNSQVERIAGERIEAEPGRGVVGFAAEPSRDAFGWLSQVERYFQMKEVTEEDRLPVIMVAMEGKALPWFRWWEYCTPKPTWAAFRDAIIRRFQPIMIQSSFEALMGIKQTGSMEEYWEHFELYANPKKDIDAEFFKSIFLNGLKEEVRAELRLHQWRSLPEMMDLAQRADERNRALQRTTGVGYGRGNIIKNYPISQTITVEAGRKTYSSSGTPSLGKAKESFNTQPANNLRVKGGSFKKLSDDELNERQKKGLCFNCDEKFGPNHVCKNKRYQIMILEEDENEPGEEEGEIEVEEMECRALQLSLNSMMGFTSKRSIIALGEIKGRPVHVLIDCGASHNFLSAKLVKELYLAVEDTPPYHVEVGDGRKIQGRGKCSQLGLQLQGWRIQQDFFIFDLGGAEVVLGMEWLASLGDIRGNFQELTLMIPRRGGTMVLKGDPSLSRTAASIRSIMKAIHEDGLGFFLTCAEVFKDHQQREEVGELEDWAGEIQADDKLRSIVQDLMADLESHPGYTL